MGYNGHTDDLTVLEPEDDAATANLGNGWRMPTREEFQELMDNTTNTWATRNGVDGRLFTASNGNILFLPVAGYRYDSDLYDPNRGYYWSSSLQTGWIPLDAHNLYFKSDPDQCIVHVYTFVAVMKVSLSVRCVHQVGTNPFFRFASVPLAVRIFPMKIVETSHLGVAFLFFCASWEAVTQKFVCLQRKTCQRNEKILYRHYGLSRGPDRVPAS